MKKKQGKKSKPAKNAAKKKTSKPTKRSAPEEIMDRKALKAVAAQLKAAGSDVKVLKSDDDAALQRKVNEALHQMPSSEVLAKLESIVPDKLVSVLKRDCLGVFIDLSDVSCVRCKDNQACVREFLKNISGGIAQLKPAMVGAKAPPPEPDPDETEVELGYEPKRALYIMNVENPNPKGDDFHDTIQAVLDEVPETMKQLRGIVAREFDQNDDEFMQTLLSMHEDGLVKFDFDLSKKDKKALREAGYDV